MTITWKRFGIIGAVLLWSLSGCATFNRADSLPAKAMAIQAQTDFSRSAKIVAVLSSGAGGLTAGMDAVRGNLSLVPVLLGVASFASGITAFISDQTVMDMQADFDSALARSLAPAP